MIVTEPGVYEMPHAEYLADPVPGGSLSSSGARLLLPPSCPAIFRYRQDHPPEPTAVFDFGHAAHKLVLGEGPPLAVLDAEDWRTKAAQQWREGVRAEGSVPLLKAEHERVQAMAAAIREHPIASALFDPERGGKPEQSLFWEYDGIWKRGRLDWIPGLANHSRGRPVLSDYKTARSADPGSIARSVANFGYHQQAAWYLEGVRVLIGADCAFVFVFQEKEAPYLVTVCELDYAALETGAALNARAAEVYRDCTEAAIWPGYSDDIELISLPPWATRIEEYA
jgi:hypothetical protein